MDVTVESGCKNAVMCGAFCVAPRDVCFSFDFQ